MSPPSHVINGTSKNTANGNTAGTTQSSVKQSTLEQSRSDVSSARTTYSAALNSGHEIRIGQTRTAYSQALVNHTSLLERNDNQLQSELDRAAQNRNIPQLESVSLRLRANTSELETTRAATATLAARRVEVTTPTPVPAPVPEIPVTGTTTPSPPVVQPTPTPVPPSPVATPTPTTTVPPGPDTGNNSVSPPTGTTVPQPVPAPGPEEPATGIFGAAGLASALPSFSNVISGQHGTSADTALAILQDVSAGRPAFRPELGTKGPVQWFVTDGNPRTGGGTAGVTLPVEFDIPRGATVVEFNDAQLKQIYDRAYPAAERVATEQYAQRYPNRNLQSTGSLSDIRFNARNIAERSMWTQVGERVAASDSGIGRVVQSADSAFSSGRPGTFMLTSRPEVVKIRGGAGALLDVIQRNGIPAEPAVVEAAERAAQQGTIQGRVRGVFRVGGRILVVTGLATDAYRIYQADDKIREVVKVGGGWAGAGAAITAYNAVTGSTNLAGPWAWAANGVGNIVAGVGGYYAGEKIAEIVYDLAFEPTPIEVQPE